MKNKFCIVVLVVSLIASLGGQTLAGEFSATGWELPIRFHLTDYDQGTVWLNPDGSFPAPGFYGNPRDAGLIPVGVDNPMVPNEDTWGIATIDQIREAYVDENHYNLEPQLQPPLWSIGEPDPSGTPMELWGIFYGETDKWLYVTAAGGQETMGSGLKYEIWAQPLGTFEIVNGAIESKQFGSAQRLDFNKYAGIGYEADGDPIPGAQLWLSGQAAPGFVSVTDRTLEMASQWATPGNLDGEAQLWVELWGGPDAQLTDGPEGTANAAWDNGGGWYQSDLGINPDYQADMRLQLDNKMVGNQIGPWDWEVTSSDPGQLYPVEEEELGCRVTGGGNDTFTDEGDGPLNKKLAKGENDDNGCRYTFGGQAGSPTGCQPQPWGNWTHSHHAGMKAVFTFHAGTASAPEGTEIDWIACSDPGGCRPSGNPPSPNKQIDFGGVGTFKNVRLKNGSDLSWIKKVDEVTGEPALFDFYVHIEDLGEPGKGGKVDPPAEHCPPEGSAGALADCDCPDFYLITIYNPDGGGDYTVYGYIKGGNLQLHLPHDCK